jgi:hypothetical protein
MWDATSTKRTFAARVDAEAAVAVLPDSSARIMAPSRTSLVLAVFSPNRSRRVSIRTAVRRMRAAS